MATDILDQEETSELSDDPPDAIAPPAAPSLIRKTAISPKAEHEVVEQAVRASFVCRTLGFVLWPLVTILMWVDAPFAGLGAGLKAIIGMIGVATSIIAAVTWGALLVIPHH